MVYFISNSLDVLFVRKRFYLYFSCVCFMWLFAYVSYKANILASSVSYTHLTLPTNREV